MFHTAFGVCALLAPKLRMRKSSAEIGIDMLFLSPGITVYILGMAFLFGAVLASFLGCMGWRMAKGESVVKGRSHCDHCGHDLSWRDLIPMVSFLMGKGRCAYCGEPVSKVSFWGEVTLSLLFVLTTLRFDVTVELVSALFFLCILYLVSMTDIFDRTIPDTCILTAIVFRLVWGLVAEPFGIRTLLVPLGNGLAVALPLLLLVLLMEKIRGMEMMGGGDIKLVFVMGMYLGWADNLLALFFACIFAIAYTAWKQQKEGQDSYIPFGPFLSLGAAAALLFGETLIGWYLSFFF